MDIFVHAYQNLCICSSQHMYIISGLEMAKIQEQFKSELEI